MKHIVFKSLSIMTKVSLVLIILLMIVVAGFTIRLSQGPINLDFAKNYVEDALNEQSDDLRVSMNILMLEWSTYKNSLLLTLGDVRLYQLEGEQEQKILEIEKAKLGLSIPYLLAGQVKPSSVVIEAPVLKLTMKDGEYDLFLSGNEIKKENLESKDDLTRLYLREKIAKILEEITEPTSTVFGQFSEMKEIILRRAILKQVILEKVITDTEVSVEEVFEEALDDIIDEVVKSVAAVEENYIALFDLAVRRSEAGLDGDLEVNLPGEEGKQAQITAILNYRKEQKDFTFDGKIFDINPSRLAFLFPQEPLLTQQDFVLNGSLQVALGENLYIQNAHLNLTIPDGHINIPEEFDEPIGFKNAKLDLSINRLEQKFTLNEFKVIVEGIPIEAKSEGYFKKGNIYFPLDIKIAEFKFEDVVKLFPKSQMGSSAADWIKNKLSKGRVFDVFARTQIDLNRGEERGKSILKIAEPRLEFKFEGLSVKYSDTLMPVTEAVGSGVYEKDSLIITAEKGDVGEVKGTDVNVELTDLSVAGGGFAKIKLKGAGPLRAALKYVEAEPIELNEKETGLDPKTVEGNIVFDLALEFPTLKDLPKEEVIVVIAGVINNAKLPKIIRDLDLTGGPYNLSFAKGKIGFKGKGELSGRPIDVDYQQYLDPKGKDFDMRVKVKLSADKGLRDVFGIGLDEYISGDVPVDVTYTEQLGGNAVANVKGSISPTIIIIKPFDFVKAQGVEGNFSLKAILKNDILKEIKGLNLLTKGFSFEKGHLLFRPLGKDDVELSRGEIQKVTLGRTDTKVDFEITPDDVLKVIANGSVIDISSFVNKDKKKTKDWKNPENTDGQAMKLSFKAERAYTTKDQYLRGAQFYIETDKDTDMTRLEVDAKIGKAGDFYVRFKPEDSSGKRTFRMESTDAGATLKAFDLYDNIIGGSILVYGVPQRGDNKGDLFGTARIQNFTVVKAPALARLLGAMSQNGMQDTLKTKGVSFEKLESEFEWRFRDDGNLLVVKDGRTSGSSLGLTFEGIADMGKSILDLSGTIIPLSGINKAIGDIPIIGMLLTGGSKGGLFAATYTVKGPSKDPKVVVNPLSALTPGFLRKILFEGDLKSKLPENKPPEKQGALNE